MMVMEQLKNPASSQIVPQFSESNGGENNVFSDATEFVDDPWEKMASPMGLSVSISTFK